MSDFNDASSSQPMNLNTLSFPQKKNKSRTKLFAGLIVFALLIVGAISAFVLFNQNQDTRNQASVANGLINVKLGTQTDQTCVSGQPCSVDVIVNTGSSNIDALQLKIAFDQNSAAAISDVVFTQTPQSTLTTNVKRSVCAAKPGFASDKVLRTCVTDADCPENQFCDSLATTTTQSTNSGFVADIKPGLNLSKNEVNNQGALLVWTLSSESIPFTTSNRDQTLGKLQFKINDSSAAISKVNINIDTTLSKATLYKTGQDSLNTPSPISLKVSSGSVSQLTYCKNDDMCPDNQYCYFEPTPSGINNFRANAYCKDKPVSGEKMNCQTDADCKSGQYCYQPPMPVCPEGKMCPDVMTAKYCQDGKPSTTPAPTRIPSPVTGQTCSTNRDCPSNYYCYQPPMPDCREGMVCTQVMPAPYCKLSTSVSTTPTPTPTKRPSPTVTMSVTPTSIACPVPDCRSGVLKQLPNEYGSCPTYTCVEPTTCQYTYTSWSACSYGVQTRSISDASAKLCAGNAPVLRRECTQSCTSNAQCAAGEYCDLGTTARTNASSSSFVATGSCRVDRTISTDINSDGITNVLDLSIVIKNLFTNSGKADINKDGVVDIADYSLVLKNIIGREYIRFDKQTIN